jgi:beta-lactamase regulating signal transducer with metallopeptidase domain|tara:strand:+ start:2831 stop:3085 length:255 start_codon:yes stop_codon:yes gene_type:complete
LNLSLITLLALVFTIAPSVAFAETVMDKDVFAPGAQFDSKPLDEAQQEDQDLADIWTYAIIIVIGIIIARIVLQVVKKRMSRST